MKVAFNANHFIDVDFTNHRDCAMARAMKEAYPLENGSYWSANPWEALMRTSNHNLTKTYNVTKVWIDGEEFETFGTSAFEFGKDTFQSNPDAVAYFELAEGPAPRWEHTPSY